MGEGLPLMGQQMLWLPASRRCKLGQLVPGLLQAPHKLVCLSLSFRTAALHHAAVLMRHCSFCRTSR